MREAIPPRGRWQYVRHWLEYGALWAIGVCFGVFQVYDRSPDYLVAAHAGFPDLILGSVATVVGPPTAAVCAEALLGRLDERLGRWAHRVLLAGFVAAWALVALKEAFDPRRAALGLVAAAIGALFVYLYTRGQFMPAVLAVLSPAPLIVLIWFLCLSSAAPRTLGESGPPVAQAKANGTPVVMVVYDEFPTLSLLGADGKTIDRRFPNFRRLAREATWYRNATTVADHTTQAVPAILSGGSPRGTAPSVGEHPRNLFSLLRGQYGMNVHESATHLCDFCPDVGWKSRLRPLASASKALIEQRVVPGRDPTAVLGVPYTVLERRNEVWNEWQHRLRGGATLNMIHAVLPHEPWWYRPDGTQHSTTLGLRGTQDDRWRLDDAGIDGQYRDHLDQVGYVDTLLGRLRRSHARLWDRALVVLVADHGVAFTAGAGRRDVSLANLAEIASVPLFVKVPGQRHGGIEDRLVTTEDVLPTIGDWLGTKWRVAGHSLRRPVSRRAVSVTASTTGKAVRANALQYVYLRAVSAQRLAQRRARIGR